MLKRCRGAQLTGARPSARPTQMSQVDVPSWTVEWPQDTVPWIPRAWFWRCILWLSGNLQTWHWILSPSRRCARCFRRKCLLKSPGVKNSWVSSSIRGSSASSESAIPMQTKHRLGSSVSLVTNTDTAATCRRLSAGGSPAWGGSFYRALGTAGGTSLLDGAICGDCVDGIISPLVVTLERSITIRSSGRLYQSLLG